ncbi:MAG: cytochrome B [Saprospiraceae bacterium]|nr:cytochrome B [Saprospiraceae bacterium]
MYHLLLAHAALRWLVFFALIWAIFRAAKGYINRTAFSKADRAAVSAASILSHIQLLVGFGLYFISPTAQYFWSERSFAWSDALFFAIVHFVLMTIAIVLITIGSALAKRETDDRAIFRAILWYYGLGFLLILIAIPWPFSPLAQRPWLRY